MFPTRVGMNRLLSGRRYLYSRVPHSRGDEPHLALTNNSRISDCASCPNKDRCCPNTTFRKIARSIHEKARDVARDIGKTDAFKESCRQRKKVEMLFAHLKRILKMDKLRLRGFSGAQDEFLLAATAQNLRRMAKWLVPEVPEEKILPA